MKIKGSIREINWVKATGVFADGCRGYVGQRQLFGVFWARGTDPRGSNLPPYRLTVLLPFKLKEDRFETEEEAKLVAYRVLKRFIQGLVEEEE